MVLYMTLFTPHWWLASTCFGCIQAAEEELAESLMDLKIAIDEVKASRTFKQVMGTLLCIGNTLNGVKVDAFDLEYLSRCVDVKDTKHKTPLLIHMVELVVERFTDSTNLHSDMPHVHRVSKVRSGIRLVAMGRQKLCQFLPSASSRY